MAKKKGLFVCQQCGHSQPNWVGRCPGCSEWNTLVEEAAPEAKAAGSRSSRGGQGVVPIHEVQAENAPRLSTGVAELDRILGGGLVPGGAILIGGEPGIGKSTLLMQVANWLARGGGKLLYVTAEESALQLKLRAERLGAVSPNLLVLAENNLDVILESIEKTRPAAVILDSVQMVFWERIGAAPGSVGQVRECAAALIAQAKRGAAPLFLVGHVTKDGTIAGPKVLEHMVDVVLQFEGDRFHAARILRAVKNRYGAVNEIGVFEMTAAGLSPVADPSRLFLSGRRDTGPGTVVTAALEGSRPFMVEVQALVATGFPGNAKRQVSGADRNRAQMLLAVLEKRAELSLFDQDVYLNVVGGASINEPGGDLAMAVAVASSLRERAFPADTVLIGEVGLGGEVRPVAQLAARLSEAGRLGFKRAMIPAGEAALAVNREMERERESEERQSVQQSHPAGQGAPKRAPASQPPLELLPIRRLDEALDWLGR